MLFKGKTFAKVGHSSRPHWSASLQEMVTDIVLLHIPRCVIWGPKYLNDLPKATQRISTKKQCYIVKEEEGFDVRPTKCLILVLADASDCKQVL